MVSWGILTLCAFLVTCCACVLICLKKHLSPKWHLLSLNLLQISCPWALLIWCRRGVLPLKTYLTVYPSSRPNTDTGLSAIKSCIRPPQSQSRTIFLCKHQCAVIDHNIFMKRIRSIDVILNDSEIFLMRTLLYLCNFLDFFPCLKTLFLDFHQEKLSCNTDIEMPDCKKNHLS